MPNHSSWFQLWWWVSWSNVGLWWGWKGGWQEFYSVGEKALSCRINQNFPPFVRRPTILLATLEIHTSTAPQLLLFLFCVLLFLIWRKKRVRDILQGLIEAKVTLYLSVCIRLMTTVLTFPMCMQRASLSVQPLSGASGLLSARHVRDKGRCKWPNLVRPISFKTQQNQVKGTQFNDLIWFDDGLWFDIY